MKKSIWILCILMTVSAVFSGCHKQPPQVTPDVTDEAPEYTFDTALESFDGIDVVLGAWWNIAWPQEPRNEAEADVVNRLTALRETKDLTFSYVTIDKDQYYDRIKNSIRRGQPLADLFWIEADRLQEFLDDELLSSFSYSGELSLNNADKWDQFCTFSSVRYGYVYGIYWGHALPGYVLYCNSDIVDTAAIDTAIADNTWNWDTLTEMAVSAANGGHRGFGGDYLDAMLATAGADVTDIIKGNENAEAILEYLHRMAAAGAVYGEDTDPAEAAFTVGLATDSVKMGDSFRMYPLPKCDKDADYISMTPNFMLLVMAKGSKDYGKIETAINLYADIMLKYDNMSGATEDQVRIADFFASDGTRIFKKKNTDYDQVIKPFIKVLLEGGTSAADLLKMWRLEFSKYPVPDVTTDPSQGQPGNVG